MAQVESKHQLKHREVSKVLYLEPDIAKEVKMPINSKVKGNQGERELSKKLREHGYCDARRGQQYNGIEGQDVVGVPGLHIEVKRVEKLNIHNAMEQSKRDAQPGETPIVAHRRNRTEWLVTMGFDDFIRMRRVYEKEERKNAD